MTKIRRATAILFSTLTTVTFLTACGSDKKSSPDREPDLFEFSSESDAAINSTVTSETITITGLAADANLTIEGGAYSIGEAEFSTEATTIGNDQTIRVQVQASSVFSTTTTVTLTIGGIDGTFSVTTEAEDTIPESFDLGANATSSTPGEWVESDLITVTGINSVSSISIDNGEFYIVGVDTYPSAATTVENGQQISVRVQSGSTLNETETATITIGGETDTFGVTMVDATPPTANVQFPTPNTLSDGTFVTLRGQAEDDFGPVTSIQVVVTTDEGATEVDNQTLTATENDNFQTTWSQRVNLATDKVNTITVTATDNTGNVQSEPQVLTVTQSTTEINFPVGEDVFIGQYISGGLAMTPSGERLYLPGNQNNAIYTVDINSGNREEFANTSDLNISFSRDLLFIDEEAFLLSGRRSSNEAIFFVDVIEKTFVERSNSATPDSDVQLEAPQQMAQALDGSIYITDTLRGLYRMDLDTGSRTLISGVNGSGLPWPENGDNPFDAPSGLLLDEANNRALVANTDTQQLFWVDLTTGVRTVRELDQSLNDFQYISITGEPNEIVLLESYVPDIEGASALYTVNLETGTVQVLSDDTNPGSENSLQFSRSLVVDQEKKIAFVGANSRAIGSRSSIKVVDITTGERIVLTYSLQDGVN